LKILGDSCSKECMQINIAFVEKGYLAGRARHSLMKKLIHHPQSNPSGMHY
jgi:hypothetical protein